MKLEEAIKKAIEAGYDWSEEDDCDFKMHDHMFLDYIFWQSLGKALEWDKKVLVGRRGARKVVETNHWFNNWHHFIDHLSKGKTVESFFETLN